MSNIAKVYDSPAVANHFIEKAGYLGLDPLQIMKLTYIAHGFVLAIKSDPLLEDDVEAWEYGPAIRRLYRFLPRGKDPVCEPLSADRAEFDPDAARIIDAVYNRYGKLSGLQLSRLTHAEGSPWKKTWDTYGKNAVIPQSLIQKHYWSIIRSSKEAHESGRTYRVKAL